MKPLISLLLLSFSLYGAQASEISLEPGSKITVSPSETMTISCGGDPVNQSRKATCSIVKRGEYDLSGEYCNYSFCAKVLRYSQVIASSRFNGPREAVFWCDREIGKN
jgi:hypothetical protein